MLRWFEKFPESVIKNHANLSIIYAWNLMMIGSLKDIEIHLDNAQLALEKGVGLELVPSPGVPTYTLNEMRFQRINLALRALLASMEGDTGRAIELGQQTLALSTDRDISLRLSVLQALSMAYRLEGRVKEAFALAQSLIKLVEPFESADLTASAWAYLGMSYVLMGRLRQARHSYEAGLDSYSTLPNCFSQPGRIAQPITEGQLYQLIGALLYEQNDLEGALTCLRKSIAISIYYRANESTVETYLSLTQLHLAQNDQATALITLEQAEQTADIQSASRIKSRVAAFRARFDLRMG